MARIRRPSQEQVVEPEETFGLDDETVRQLPWLVPAAYERWIQANAHEARVQIVTELLGVLDNQEPQTRAVAPSSGPRGPLLGLGETQLLYLEETALAVTKFGPTIGQTSDCRDLGAKALRRVGGLDFSWMNLTSRAGFSAGGPPSPSVWTKVPVGRSAVIALIDNDENRQFFATGLRALAADGLQVVLTCLLWGERRYSNDPTTCIAQWEIDGVAEAL